MVDLPANAVELDGLVIGNPQTGPYSLADLNIGGKPEITAGDKPRPREDGVFFGRDLLSSGRLIVLEGSVSTRDGSSCRQAWQALSEAWDAQYTRYTPGAVRMLRLRLADGDTKIVFGRPRELAPKDDVRFALLGVGRIDFVAQFRCVDHLLYADPARTSDVGIVSDTVPGLVSPLRSPLSSKARAAPAGGELEVGGTHPAWPAATIYGPIVNPTWFDVGVGFLQFRTELKADQFLSFDTAPWNRGALVDGVTNVAGALTQGSLRLSRATLTPGAHRVVLRGTSDTGTAHMTTSWREAATTY